MSRSPDEPRNRDLTPEQRDARRQARRASRLAARDQARIQAQADDARAQAALDAIHPHAPEHPLNAVSTLPDQVALSGRNRYSEAHKQHLRHSLEQVDLRPVPYPCASVVTVVSDLDGTDRARYARYMDLLVGQGGLDFGDSIWLVQQVADDPMPDDNRPDPDDHFPAGLGFYGNALDTGAHLPATQYRYAHTFRETVIEFHKGNIDHFHSYLPNGPRVVTAQDPRVAGDSAVFDLGPLVQDGRIGAMRCALAGLCVLGRPGHQLALRAARVKTVDGDWIDMFGGGEASESKAPEVRLHLPDTERGLLDFPLLRDITDIEVVCADPTSAGAVTGIVLVTMPGHMLVSRLRNLRDVFNVETPLITEHAAYHFRDARAARKRDEIQAGSVAENASAGLRSVVHGSFHAPDGRRLVTTEADDPASVSRVLPEAVRDLGVCFVTPAGSVATSERGWDSFDVVTPTRTRAGDGLYVAQRTLPKTSDTAGREHSRASTFSARVGWMLKEAAQQPGGVWPVYTHLGSIQRVTNGKSAKYDNTLQRLNQPLPEPYFARQPIEDLQDAVFNISGTRSPSERVWFARASQAYDYAYILRHLPAHVERPDANTVCISSWHDPILAQKMPRAPGQLYGVTFYCEDPATARISLDGRPLRLARNPPDDTGRPSVTVMEMEIQHPVFHQLDPVRRAPDRVHVDGHWQWQQTDDCGFGTLSDNGGGTAMMRLEMTGFHATGAQALAFERRGADPFGVVIETRDGARFYVGDAVLCPEDNAARYLLQAHAPASDTWQTIIAPFNDMTWSKGAQPGCSLPNAPLAAVELLGARGSVDVRNLGFHRARSTRLSMQAGHRFCVAGRVLDHRPGQVVRLLADDDGRMVHEQQVDQRGAFCFTGIECGIYAITSIAEDQTYTDRQGRFFEVVSDVATLELVKQSH